MRKALFMVVLMLGLAILSATHEQNPSHNEKGPSEPSTGTPVSPNPPPNQPKPEQQGTSRQEEMERFYKFIGWPNGIEALAIILTLGAIVWQSDETRKAARAALLNAQAVINAERPWLIVVVKSPAGPHSIFTVHLRNKGKNPAQIVETRIGCARVENLSHLPAKAPYGGVGMLKNHVVVPGGAARAHIFDHSIFKHAWKDESREFPNEGDLFVFGKILYRDLANPNRDVIHETRWIAIYQPPVEEIPIGGDEGNRLVSIDGIGIPDEYDRHS
jgi:hypothetical protein